AEVAGHAQLGPLEADVDHPVEHVVGGRDPVLVEQDLVDTERDGGTGDAHRGAGHGTSGVGCDQGLMTIFTASPERIRPIPATVSSSGIVALTMGARLSWPLSTRRIAEGNVKLEMYEPRIDRPFSTISIWWTGGRALAFIPKITTRAPIAAASIAWGRTAPTASTTTSAPRGMISARLAVHSSGVRTSSAPTALAMPPR